MQVPKTKVYIFPVVVENHKNNIEVGRRFYQFIFEEIKKLKGENKNGEKTKKEN